MKGETEFRTHAADRVGWSCAVLCISIHWWWLWKCGRLAELTACSVVGSQPTWLAAQDSQCSLGWLAGTVVELHSCMIDRGGWLVVDSHCGRLTVWLAHSTRLTSSARLAAPGSERSAHSDRLAAIGSQRSARGDQLAAIDPQSSSQAATCSAQDRKCSQPTRSVSQA